MKVRKKIQLLKSIFQIKLTFWLFPKIDFSNQIYIILTKFKNQFFFSSQIQKFQLSAKIHFLNWIKFSIKTKNDFSYQLTFSTKTKINFSNWINFWLSLKISFFQNQIYLLTKPKDRFPIFKVQKSILILTKSKNRFWFSLSPKIDFHKKSNLQILTKFKNRFLIFTKSKNRFWFSLSPKIDFHINRIYKFWQSSKIGFQILLSPKIDFDFH